MLWSRFVFCAADRLRNSSPFIFSRSTWRQTATLDAPPGGKHWHYTLHLVANTDTTCSTWWQTPALHAPPGGKHRQYMLHLLANTDTTCSTWWQTPALHVPPGSKHRQYTLHLVANTDTTHGCLTLSSVFLRAKRSFSSLMADLSASCFSV